MRKWVIGLGGLAGLAAAVLMAFRRSLEGETADVAGDDLVEPEDDGLDFA